MRGICLLAIGFAAATAGCGDGKGSTGTGGTGGAGGTGGSGASCAGLNTACGGDVVGTWAIAEICNFMITSTTPVCPEVQYTGSTVTEMGTFTFRADGTASEDVTGTLTLHESVPASCLDVLGTCAGIDASIQMAVQDGTYTSGSCVSAASGSCECTVIAPLTGMTSATYTTSGSMLTVTSDSSGNTSTSSYCVQGSTLGLSVPNGSGAPLIYRLTRQ
jgi:hypothetical protein